MKIIQYKNIQIIDFAFMYCRQPVQLIHLNTFSDKILTSNGELLKQLFLANVENPKKTMHYTGTVCSQSMV